ncbi:MAG: hypothetical protein GX225_02620 [Clostridiales bacterium]|nr:hypothetical protein [Clostridiales bacterium]
MRITNGMMINNSLYNINNNKRIMDTLNTRVDTKKKIQRPSEDPIVAIRALRLRTTYAEISQYLDKNIPDARSWMKTTNDALSSINSVLTEISYYCNQGVNDYNTVAERETLVTTLKQLRSQIYADGDADINGNSLFTGYKTDATLTFKNAEPNTTYSITQKFKGADVDNMNRIAGISTNSIYTADQRDITNINFHVIKVAYDSLDSAGAVTLTNSEGTQVVVPIETRSKDTYDAAGNSVYTEVATGAAFIPETGELLLSDSVYQSMASGGSLEMTYNKTGFQKGDLKPEHYFDCTNQTTGINYTSADQEINYTINFNQTIKVNTQAKDVLTHDFGRDLDEIIYSVTAAVDAQNKIAKLNEQLAASASETEQLQIKSMITAAELELSYAEENMGTAFSKSLDMYSKHQQTLNYELADLGARMIRLTLNEERLSAQKLNVHDLKSQNEEVNLATVAVQFKSATDVYDASLAAAAKVVQNTLLDFI